MTDVKAQFDRDGFVVVPGLLSSDWVEAMRQHLDTREAPPNGLIPDASLRADEATSTLASELLGAPVELFGATYIVKQPRSSWRVSWHQDGEPWRRQWGIEQAITVWAALDDSGPRNGGLRMIPGSHLGPLRALEPVADAFDVFGWASPAELVDESRAVDLVMMAGDVSAHHPAMVHGSGPNTSDHPRRALSLRYRVAGT